MSQKSTTGRRSFLKRLGGAATVAGVGALGSQPTAAATQTMVVSCRDGIGTYEIWVDDAVSTTTYEGSLDASSNPSDTYTIDGHITYIKLDGWLNVERQDSIPAWNGDRNMTVFGSDADYYVQITGGTLAERNNSLESSDTQDSDSCNGSVSSSDDDELITHNGTLYYVQSTCVEPVYINHPL